MWVVYWRCRCGYLRCWLVCLVLVLLLVRVWVCGLCGFTLCFWVWVGCYVVVGCYLLVVCSSAGFGLVGMVVCRCLFDYFLWLLLFVVGFGCSCGKCCLGYFVFPVDLWWVVLVWCAWVM